MYILQAKYFSTASKVYLSFRTLQTEQTERGTSIYCMKYTHFFDTTSKVYFSLSHRQVSALEHDLVQRGTTKAAVGPQVQLPEREQGLLTLRTYKLL